MGGGQKLLQLVVFVIDGQRYALELSVVERVLPMVAVSPLPEAPAVAVGAMSLHGQAIPVLDVRRRFGLPARDYGPEAKLLVARTKRFVVALPVDDVVGVTEASADAVVSPDAVLPHIGHVSGIVSLSDGLLLIHDLGSFLSLDEERQLSAALSEGATA